MKNKLFASLLLLVLALNACTDNTSVHDGRNGNDAYKAPSDAYKNEGSTEDTITTVTVKNNDPAKNASSDSSTMPGSMSNQTNGTRTNNADATVKTDTVKNYKR